MSDPKEFASPACSANEADDAYMGFASRAEIARAGHTRKWCGGCCPRFATTPCIVSSALS